MIFLGFSKVFTHPANAVHDPFPLVKSPGPVPSRCTLGTIAFRPRRPESPRHSSPQKKKLEMASLEPAGVKIFGIHILIPIICIYIIIYIYYIYTVHIYCIHHILHVNKLPAWVSNGPQLKKIVISEGKSPAKPPGNLHIHPYPPCKLPTWRSPEIWNSCYYHVTTHQYTIQSEHRTFRSEQCPIGSSPIGGTTGTGSSLHGP